MTFTAFSAPIAILGIDDPEWNAVVIAAITAVAVTLATTWIKERARLSTEKRLHRAKADTDYEYEQRKKLRDKIGEFRGQLVEAAADFNYRLTNLDANVERPWLNVGGVYSAAKGDWYYFRTTVYRFAVLASVANRFERDALHIDSRIAEPSDLTFLLYAKAFRWALTDVSLFKGVDYDDSQHTDHFYTDRLRQMCAAMYQEGRELRFDEFEDRIPSSEFADALHFFDGITPGTLRWDRLVTLRLFLLAFINRFGYPMQHSHQAYIDAVAQNIRHAEVAENLVPWVAKLGLGSDSEANRICTAVANR